MNLNIPLHAERRIQHMISNGTPTGAGTWTPTPVVAGMVGTPAQVTDGTLSGSEVLFKASAAGNYALESAVTLTDGQKIVEVFNISVK